MVGDYAMTDLRHKGQKMTCILISESTTIALLSLVGSTSPTCAFRFHAPDFCTAWKTNMASKISAPIKPRDDMRPPEFDAKIIFRKKPTEGGVATPEVLTDFTFYDERPFNTVLSRNSELKRTQRRGSIESEVILTWAGVSKEIRCRARGLICKCQRNNDSRLSVTVRIDRSQSDALNGKLQGAKELSISNEYRAFSQLGTADPVAFKLLELSPYRPLVGERSDPGTIDKVIAQLDRAIFGKDAEESSQEASLHGAILLAGRTKCKKSVVARGLVHSYLSRLLRGNQSERRPHLLTLEDPIEALFFDPNVPNNVAESDWPIDYTARDRSTGDFSTVQDALMQDALRQTPAIVLVGEIRDKNDLKAVLEFGGTGHLVIGTLHASSLVDTFQRVLECVPKATPAERGQTCQRLLSVVHLSHVSAPTAKYGTVLPSLWRRSEASIAAFVSDGLSSILPYGDDPPRVEGDAGGQNAGRSENGSRRRDCLGRQWFARQLFKSDDYKTRKEDMVAEAALHDLRNQ
jgi:hypothetical protein